VYFGQVELSVCKGGRRHIAGLVLGSLYFIKPRIAVSAVGQYITMTQLIGHTGPTLETLRISSPRRDSNPDSSSSSRAY
jgi:hypothetical protein